MPALIRKILSSRSQLQLCPRRLLHYVPNSVVIVSAVRTPWGQPLGQLATVTSTHLCSVVVEAAVRQSGAPLEKVQHVYMAMQSKETHETNDNLQYGELLKKAKVLSRESGSLKSLLKSIDTLKRLSSEIVVVGGVQSASERQIIQEIKPQHPAVNKSSNDYYRSSKLNHLKASTEGIFDSEIIPLKVIKQTDKRRHICQITQDELADPTHNHDTDGAGALVLATKETANNYDMKPLAIIKDITLNSNGKDDECNTPKIIQNLLDRINISIEDIQHWEIDCINYETILKLQQHFQIPEGIINPHGSCLTFGQSHTVSLSRTLGHITHSLKSNQVGCVVNSNGEQVVAILIEKMPTSTTPLNALPRLTLFTKDSCHLCDILVEELDQNFHGEYQLEKIYIDRKENVRYLRLYRHDIPVLYLNGQFLCMHSLNVRLLRRKLEDLKK